MAYVQSTNLVIPNMSGAYKCQQCSMTFDNQPLLTKHKQRFCIGSPWDPNDLQLRRGFRSMSPLRYSSPDDRDPDYRRPNNDQMRSLAENYGRQMQFLHTRNKDLEKQRDDIAKRLEGLGRRPIVMPAHDNTADLLREMRDQERRNQQALDDLKRQMYDMNNNQKVNVIEVERPMPAPQAAPPPEPKKQFMVPIYHGKSLPAEISAIRQAYLQNGGNDPETLAQMALMLAEAQAIEDAANQKPEKKSPREKPNDNTELIKFMEAENMRLNSELRLLHEQKLMAQNRGRSDKEEELERELRRLRQEQMDRLERFQREMDDFKMLMLMERNKPQPQPPSTVIHQAPAQGVNVKPYVEVEGIQAVDQYPNRYLPLYVPVGNNRHDTQMYRPVRVPRFPNSRQADGLNHDLNPDSYRPLA